VGYVSLADIFVGSYSMARELFSKTGPVPPQSSLAELEDGPSDATVCGVDGNAEDVDAVQLIAQAPPSHDTVKTDLTLASTPMLSEQASVEEHPSNATDITALASSSQQDKVVAIAFPPFTGPHRGDFSSEQSGRPQGFSDPEKRFAPGEDHASHGRGETAPAPQPDDDASALMPAPSDESAFESAQPDEPSGRTDMPPAIEAFMRHLAEYLHSQNHQTATPSSALEEAFEPKLGASTEAQKDTDRVPFPGEPCSQGESSGSARHSGLTVVDPEQTEDCFSVRMGSPVKMVRDNHPEGNSGAAGGAQTNDATTRGISLREMDPSAEQPPVKTDIAEPVASMERFAPLSSDAHLHPRVTGGTVPHIDNRLSADKSDVRVSLDTASPDHQLEHVVRDGIVARSADGPAEPPKKTLSASYYRRRAEVLRVALITTSRPEAAVRLRAFMEKYRALADRAARDADPCEVSQRGV
jgi:hypothetical protein